MATRNHLIGRAQEAGLPLSRTRPPACGGRGEPRTLRHGAGADRRAEVHRVRGGSDSPAGRDQSALELGLCGLQRAGVFQPARHGRVDHGTAPGPRPLRTAPRPLRQYPGGRYLRRHLKLPEHRAELGSEHRRLPGALAGRWVHRQGLRTARHRPCGGRSHVDQDRVRRPARLESCGRADGHRIDKNTAFQHAPAPCETPVIASSKSPASAAAEPAKRCQLRTGGLRPTSAERGKPT